MLLVFTHLIDRRRILINLPHWDIKLTTCWKFSSLGRGINGHFISSDIIACIIGTRKWPADWRWSEDYIINEIWWNSHFILKFILSPDYVPKILLTAKTIFCVCSSYDIDVPHSSRPCSSVKIPSVLVSLHAESLPSEPTNASWIGFNESWI